MLKYYKNVIKYNENVPYGIGIITGWKDTGMILDKLSEESLKKVVACGNLYTKNGINYIIANLFLNPNITDLIVLEDSSIGNNTVAEGVQALITFLKTGEIDFELKFEFTEHHLQQFRNYYQNHITVVKRDNLEKTLSSFKVNSKNWYEVTEIEAKTQELSKQIVSEKVGFTIRANTVYEAWNRSLKLIHTYGFLKPSDYDEQQLELINLSIIIREEDLKQPSMEGIIDINKLESYENSIVSSEIPDGVKYTYGNRYRDVDGNDQLEYMVNTLKEKSYSRRSVATLWNPNIDMLEDEVPCLNLYQAIIEGEYLYLIAYIRANDIYNAWPINIYGILKIQEELCKRLNCKKGYVNTIAGSAHVYERNFKDLEERFKNTNISFCEEDERGYFTVELEDNKIKVTFYSITGEELRNFIGNNASELRTQCAFYISNIDHAFYLGQELMKAEIALQNNINYIQDQNLNLKGKTKRLENNQ